MIDTKYVTQDKRVFFDIAKELIKPGDKVLDIGAGDGTFAKHCGRDDFYLYDGNANSIDVLKKEFPYTYYGRLPDLPFQDGFFDVIHCSHVVEHLEPELFYNTLKEIDRCLKENGYLVVSAPLLWDRFYDDLSHVKPYTPFVFKKYLGVEILPTLSRPLISKYYKDISVQYRYREIPLLDNFYNLGENFIVKLVFKIFNLLQRLGFRKYIKTGFTLVFQKKN